MSGEVRPRGFRFHLYAGLEPVLAVRQVERTTEGQPALSVLNVF